MRRFDLLIVGAGPAGMAAAITARRHGLDVLVLDEQPTPGGQIWRSVERTSTQDGILGDAYVEGRAVVAAFRASGATYLPGARVWHIEPGFRAFFTQGTQAQAVEAGAVVLATGAQERPVPFQGWTLPGVMTVGAAQILLKSAGQIPEGRVCIAGSGPLPLLYAVQFMRAGGQIAAYLDTTPAGQWRAALGHLPRALQASTDLAKGLSWMRALRKSGSTIMRGVQGIEAQGKEHLTAVRYRSSRGASHSVDCDTLLVHEGVVPHLHAPLSLECAIDWNPAQDCFAPVLDEWGQTGQQNLFICGDGAGIAGARAAGLRGELAALRVCARLGKLSETALPDAARAPRRKLGRELAARPFLDALFKPRREIFNPADSTVICRCEEVLAGDIRALANIGSPGPNQIKAATRAGMGPCQGRMCGHTVTRLLSESQNRPPAEVGFFHIRSPIKPVSVSELASLDQSNAAP